MKKKERYRDKINRFLNSLYIKLFRINDTPQRIALGFGLGVFSGILPGTGPLAALFLAFILRVNRASALLGSLLTNTWISFLTFILAIKVGSGILGVSWSDIQQDWDSFIRGFHWLMLFKLSVLKVIWPIIVGYIVIGFSLGLLAYLITLIIIIKVKYASKNRGHISR